jgi:RIO-like serine/threonine protein kinase
MSEKTSIKIVKINGEIEYIDFPHSDCCHISHMMNQLEKDIENGKCFSYKNGFINTKHIYSVERCDI